VPIRFPGIRVACGAALVEICDVILMSANDPGTGWVTSEVAGDGRRVLYRVAGTDVGRQPR
jgi:hypothetical protein